MEATFLNRITINPLVCHGKPTIRNKRYIWLNQCWNTFQQAILWKIY